MSFKKRETNQNKIRHPGRKRKIIATIALSLSLLFGKARLSSFQSSSPNFDNKVVQERSLDDQEFCSLEENDQQVIWAKTGDSAPSTGRGQPSKFPIPPSGGRPSRPELGDLLARIYGSCDSFSTDPKVEIATSDENELKKFTTINKIFEKLLQY